MGFVVLGLLASTLKILGWTSVAGWSWWIVLSPFAAAAAWWTFADLSGLTRREAQRRHEDRVKRRRAQHLDAMGMTAGGNGADPAPRQRRSDAKS